MRKLVVLGIEVKIHNKREEKLCRMIILYAKDCVSCYSRGLNYTTQYYIDTINGMVTALFSLDCIDKPHTFSYMDIYKAIAPEI